MSLMFDARVGRNLHPLAAEGLCHRRPCFQRQRGTVRFPRPKSPDSPLSYSLNWWVMRCSDAHAVACAWVCVCACVSDKNTGKLHHCCFAEMWASSFDSLSSMEEQANESETNQNVHATAQSSSICASACVCECVYGCGCVSLALGKCVERRDQRSEKVLQKHRSLMNFPHVDSFCPFSFFPLIKAEKKKFWA